MSGLVPITDTPVCHGVSEERGNGEGFGHGSAVSRVIHTEIHVVTWRFL